MHVFCRHPAPCIGHVGVMPAGRIHGSVTQNIGNQVNISRFVIQICRIGAPQLMGTDSRLQRSCDGGVFLNQVLNSPLGNPAPLQAEEKGLLVPGQRLNLFAFRQVVGQSFCDFRREVENHLIPAFAGNQKGIVFQIHVPQIYADTLADPDAGPQKQT